jgi:3-hydroxy-D-aspartate aldolase
MPIAAVDTPALILDLDRMNRNIERMAQLTRRHGVALRPHAKSHKSAEIGRRQVNAGAIGLCCQKVSEAEAMVDAGISDVFIANEIVGAAKLRRLAELARRAAITATVDTAAGVAALAHAAANAGTVISTVVEIDTGDARAGVVPGMPAALIARDIAASDHLRFMGLQAYKGGVEHVVRYADRQLQFAEVVAHVRATLEALRPFGLKCLVVTGGGTGTSSIAAASGVFTELQPGTYIFMDGNYAALMGSERQEPLDFEASLLLLTTVMSRGAANRAMVDAGTKAVSTDAGMPIVYGRPDIRYVRGDDEHGRLALSGEASELLLGEKLLLQPSNCDPTVNLHDWYVVVQGDTVVAVWPVTARGAFF